MKRIISRFILVLMVALTFVSTSSFVSIKAEENNKPTYDESWSTVISKATDEVDYSLKDSTYTVYTETGLAYVLSVVDSSKTILLANDLDFSARYWDCPAKTFDGVTFDGNNKTIKGLFFDKQDCFLSWEAINSSFKNIKIEVNIISDHAIYLFANRATGNSITVENCSIKGNVTYDFKSEKGQTASILFYAIGCTNVKLSKLDFDLVVNYKNIVQANKVGLLTNYIQSQHIDIENITIKGKINFENAQDKISEWNHYGIIAGHCTTLKVITDSYNLKDCKLLVDFSFNGKTNFGSFGGYFGALAGPGKDEGFEDAINLNIENCSYEGNIIAECEQIESYYFGGMVGYIGGFGEVTVKDSSIKGMIKVDVKDHNNFEEGIGGFAGRINGFNFTMSNFESDMPISIKSQHYCEDIDDQYKYGSIYSIGGAIGYLSVEDKFTIKDSNFKGDISLVNQGLYYASGMVGASCSSTDSGFDNCNYSGDITLDHVGDIHFVAGILSYGWQWKSSYTFSMINSNYRGDITLINGCDNVEDIAGLLGRSNSNVNMFGCSYVGDITVDGVAFNETCGYVGGLASRMFGKEIKIKNSYYEGDIIFKNDKNIHMVGGLIAYAKGNVQLISDGDAYTDISVNKKWVGYDNIPENIEVQLYADEEAIGEPIKLCKENDWQYSWTNLLRPLQQAKQESENNLTYHKGDIIIEDSTAYKSDGLWVGGLIADHEGEAEITNVYQLGNIVVKNVDGRNKLARVASWLGGCGNTNKEDGQMTDYPASSLSKDSYCVSDITISDCYNMFTLHVGGVIGCADKKDTQADFVNFYYQGKVSVDHTGTSYFGSLFGYLSQIGKYENFNYDVQTVSAQQKDISLCGNIGFDEEMIKKNFVYNDMIAAIVEAQQYSAKEQQLANNEVSYDIDGTSITITNTYKETVPATGDDFYSYAIVMLVSFVGILYFVNKRRQIN